VSWCYRGYVVAGDPDAVCEQVGAYFDVGLDGMVFNMHDAQGPRTRPPGRQDPDQGVRLTSRSEPDRPEQS
jgi:hypothetical protein